MIPAFEVVYASYPGSVRRAITDEVLTIAPRPRSNMPGKTARHIRYIPRRLMFSTSSQAASSTSRKSPLVITPALLKRISTPPNISRARRSAPRAVSRSATSPAYVTAVSCVTGNSLAVSSSRSPSRSTSTSRAPCSAKTAAVPAPIPEAAPVMIATLSQSFISAPSSRLLIVGSHLGVLWHGQDLVKHRPRLVQGVRPRGGQDQLQQPFPAPFIVGRQLDRHRTHPVSPDLRKYRIRQTPGLDAFDPSSADQRRDLDCEVARNPGHKIAIVEHIADQHPRHVARDRFDHRHHHLARTLGRERLADWPRGIQRRSLDLRHTLRSPREVSCPPCRRVLVPATLGLGVGVVPPRPGTAPRIAGV